jgi:hypothetical protein
MLFPAWDLVTWQPRYPETWFLGPEALRPRLSAGLLMRSFPLTKIGSSRPKSATKVLHWQAIVSDRRQSNNDAPAPISGVLPIGS